MPAGGRITIETKNVTIDRDYVLSQEDELAAGEYVMLSVSDAGSGMPAEVAKRAFEPFFEAPPGGIERILVVEEDAARSIVGEQLCCRRRCGEGPDVERRRAGAAWV